MPQRDGSRGSTTASYSHCPHEQTLLGEDIAMTKPTRHLAALCVLATGLTLAACSAQRDDFNPVRLACPGDFDPQTNKCIIQTGN